MSAKIIQGDDVTFKIKVSKEDGSCFDLTNVTAATIKIPLTAGGEQTLSLGSEITIPTPLNGEVVVAVTDTISATLKTGKHNIELILDESSAFTTLQFKNGVEVVARYY